MPGISIANGGLPHLLCPPLAHLITGTLQFVVTINDHFIIMIVTTSCRVPGISIANGGLPHLLCPPLAHLIMGTLPQLT